MSTQDRAIKESLTPQAPNAGDLLHGLVRVCSCGKCRTCKHREYMRAWYRRPDNAEKVKRRVKRHKDENPKHYSEYERSRRPNKEARKVANAEWVKANPNKVREIRRKCLRRSRMEADDRYIKGLLSSKSNLKPSDIPQPLVELKREQLKLKRLCKKSRTSTN